MSLDGDDGQKRDRVADGSEVSKMDVKDGRRENENQTWRDEGRVVVRPAAQRLVQIVIMKVVKVPRHLP